MNVRGLAKRRGQEAAKVWLATADTGEMVRLAGYDFKYDIDTLDTLCDKGFHLPSSSDVVFSWGFYKQVKGHVFSKIHKSKNRSTLRK